MASERLPRRRRCARGRAGKRARLLRRLNRTRIEAPVYRTASTLELQAWSEAHSIATIWRMHYRLPPNDPRFLDLTEEDMLRDLFVIRYHQHFARLANDPHYAAEQASLDPAVRNRFDRLQQALEEDDTLGEMARAHHRQQAVVRRERTAEGPHADQEPEGGFRTIMLGGGTR